MRIVLSSAFIAACLCVTTASAAAQSREERIARARSLFEEGVAAYEAGRIDVAVQKLLAAQRSYRSPEIAYNIARCFERMGEATRGIYWYRAYLEHGRPDEAARRDVERRIAALREVEQRQRAQILAAPPSDSEIMAEARTFFERGVAMFQRRQYEAAMQAFTAAHRFAPFPELLYNMALTAERLSQTRDAIDYYREYLRLRRDAPDRAQVERRIAELRAQREAGH